MPGNDLTSRSKAGQLATTEKLWLLNLDNGRVLEWQPYLAARKRFIDCTADGQPINPGDIPGDHPFIRKTTTELRDRLKSAGANEDTLADIGRQLTEDTAARFRQLEHDHREAVKMLGSDRESLGTATGAIIRIHHMTEKRAEFAKTELRNMAIEAMMQFGLSRAAAARRLAAVRN